MTKNAVGYKAELLQLNRTQFPSLGIFVIKKLEIKKTMLTRHATCVVNRSNCLHGYLRLENIIYFWYHFAKKATEFYWISIQNFQDKTGIMKTTVREVLHRSKLK